LFTINIFYYICFVRFQNLQLRNEELKRDPRLGKKYIILIYKSIIEGVQIPLFPNLKIKIELNPIKSLDFMGFPFNQY
jgi:hypothetical protein